MASRQTVASSVRRLAYVPRRAPYMAFTLTGWPGIQTAHSSVVGVSGGVSAGELMALSSNARGVSATAAAFVRVVMRWPQLPRTRAPLAQPRAAPTGLCGADARV